MAARAVLAAILAPAAAAAEPTPPPLIAVDVGHSLAKPGATSARGRPEFDFNRQLAGVVGDALTDHGYAVRTIGSAGDIDQLTERTREARGAALLLSLHHDSVQPQYLSTWQTGGREQRYSDRYAGFSVFVSRRNPFPEASFTCAHAIGMALRAQGMTPSLHHAEPIAGENRTLADARNGVYWFDDLVVLRMATMPAVLLEAGIIVNRAEEERLSNPATRQRIADAVVEAIPSCLGGTPR